MLAPLNRTAEEVDVARAAESDGWWELELLANGSRGTNGIANFGSVWEVIEESNAFDDDDDDDDGESKTVSAAVAVAALVTARAALLFR